MKSLFIALCTVAASFTAVAAEQHSALGYERLLIPVVAPFGVGGVNGSLWYTQFAARNDAPRSVQIFQDECAFFCLACGPVIECTGGTATSPHAAFTGLVLPYDPRAGAFLYVERPYADSVSFNLRLQELSRLREGAGTEIPVVREREFRTSTTQLLNVPMRSNFRQQLRIFGVSSPSGEGRVTVRIFAMNGVEPLATTDLSLLVGERSRLRNPDDTPRPSNPAYAELANIGDVFRGALAGVDQVRMEIEPVTPGLVFWPMISVTNNETQQVTLVTPQ